MVGLDVTHKTIINGAIFDHLKSANNRHTDFIYAITQHYMQLYASRGIDGMPVTIRRRLRM